MGASSWNGIGTRKPASTSAAESIKQQTCTQRIEKLRRHNASMRHHCLKGAWPGMHWLGMQCSKQEGSGMQASYSTEASRTSGSASASGVTQ